MKDSEILKKARELIADGTRNYICNALTLVCDAHPDTQEQVSALIRWVKHMLAPSGEDVSGLGSWLQRKGIKLESGLTDGPIRDLRLRWLDWMIQYCELEEADWTPWLGDETPPKTCSAVIFRNGIVAKSISPSEWCWNHADTSGDIIAYKP